MDARGAYGGVKAGAAFDPLTFAQRPQVILRSVCLLFSLVVFGCLYSEGWYWNEKEKKELCTFNNDPNACEYGSMVSFLGLLSSVGFLVGEYLFEQMSSVRTRKHYVLIDLFYSGFWSVLYFFCFCYLSHNWMSTPEGNYSASHAQGAIYFSFFSFFAWGACTWLAIIRFVQGHGSAFAPNYEADPSSLPEAAYTSYPGGPDSDTGYQEAPFSGNQQQGQGDYQAPAY